MATNDLWEANKRAALDAKTAAAKPVGDAARTYAKPVGDAAHAKLKAWGKGKIVVVLIAVCIVMAIIGVGTN
jgi:hypothetical protein